MNLLAHAYLSFEQPEILVGNMISDYVKGRKQYDYPNGIQQGIRLHRAIDHFTDQHPATHIGKQVFKSAVGLYAGAFMDVVYDHFLALDENELSEQDWQPYTRNVYSQLQQNIHFLPERFAAQVPHMSTHNWLYNYRYPEAIEKSFGGLVRRAKYLNDHLEAFKIFENNYDFLRNSYASFFPDVKKFAESELALLQIK
ncbi:MAG: ACP phosphodiesterase [Chitinophagaceae bacterium]|nr:ACP phosphodiesterase [Chitinophagaceae bacterium]